MNFVSLLFLFSIVASVDAMQHEPPLFSAARAGNLLGVHAVIQAGTGTSSSTAQYDLGHGRWTNLTPLHVAGSPEVVVYLLLAGADAGADGGVSALHAAVHYGRMEVIEALLHPCKFYDRYEKTMKRIVGPSWGDQLREVKSYLPWGHQMQFDMAQLRAEFRVDPTDPVEVAAAAANAVEERERRQRNAQNDYLRQRRVTVDVRDEFDETPLVWAVRANKVDAAKLLTGAGADCNVLPHDHLSLLFLASSAAMTELLLKKILPIDTIGHQTLFNYTVQQISARHAEPGKMNALINAGVRVNGLDGLEATYITTAIQSPIVQAVLFNDFDALCRELLHDGNNLGERINGINPLNAAVGQGNVRTVALLIMLGLPYQTISDGVCLIDYWIKLAMARNEGDLVAFLQSIKAAGNTNIARYVAWHYVQHQQLVNVSELNNRHQWHWYRWSSEPLPEHDLMDIPGRDDLEGGYNVRRKRIRYSDAFTGAPQGGMRAAASAIAGLYGGWTD